MDLTPSGGIHSPKSPETDTDTETPLQTHLSKALSLTSNGSLKPHHHRIHPSPPPPQQQLPQMVLVSYKECLKNHACTLGGLALDGCGEFMPPPPRHASSTISPTSLKCAACGCHRNFHRRECIPASAVMAPQPQPPPQIQWTSSASPGGSTSSPSPSPASPPASPSPQSFYSSAPHVLLALSTSQSVPPPPLDETHCQNPIFSPISEHPSGRKRARTKFTVEQKEKMSSFAEKLGWKMARGAEEKLLEQFCLEIGVRRDVFKVWMHNNKARRERERGNTGNGNTTTRHISYDFNSNVGNSDSGHNFEGRVITSDSNVLNTNTNTNTNNTYDSYDRFQIESKVHVLGCNEGSSPSC